MSGRDKLLGWLDAERERQVEFLQRFARIDTCQPAGRHARRPPTSSAPSSTREGIAHRTEAPQAADAQPDRQL